MSKKTLMSLDRGVLWINDKDKTEVSNVTIDLLKAAPDLLKGCEELLRKIDALGYAKCDSTPVKELLDLIDYYLDTPIKKARRQ